MKCIFLVNTASRSYLVCNYIFFTFMLNDLTYCVDGFGMHKEDSANLKRNIVVVLKRECIYSIDSNISISFFLYTSYHIWG